MSNPSRSDRLKSVQRLLRTCPENPRAWFWEIEVRLLKFLVAVYGDRECRARLPALQSPHLKIPRVLADWPRERKSRAEVRRVLEAIVEANRGLLPLPSVPPLPAQRSPTDRH
jgi:hypothetical protein